MTSIEMIFITRFFFRMMPKNPQNIVANTQASNTGIACWIRIEKEEKGQGAGRRGDRTELGFEISATLSNYFTCSLLPRRGTRTISREGVISPCSLLPASLFAALAYYIGFL
jgi:hypothetical protein